MAHCNTKLPLHVAADTSAMGLGAVLSHLMPNRTEQLVTFTSRTLTSSENQHAQMKKEALGLVFAVRELTLRKNHKPLTTILCPKNAIPTLVAVRLQKWALLLSTCTYDIAYKPANHHGNADGFSCLPLPECNVLIFYVPSCLSIS